MSTGTSAGAGAATRPVRAALTPDAALVNGDAQTAPSRHWLHSDPEVPWGVSNCYVDLWLEVLNWLGLEPLASLAFCVAADYRGDQWTFLKPPIADLSLLYGLQVDELAVWQPLPEHIAFHLAVGHLLVTEADAFHLPDTEATTYLKRHQKTAIAPIEIDLEAGRMCYFHDRGLHLLEGDDLRGLFGPAGGLPPYVELVELVGLRRSEPSALAQDALGLLRSHLSRRPASNPFVRWRGRFPADLQMLSEADEDAFHVYAFTHVRQAGAAFQYAGCFLSWLESQLCAGLDGAAAEMAQIGVDLKAFMLRLARAVRGRTLDWQREFDALASRWDRAMTALESAVAPASGEPARKAAAS